MKLLVLGGTVFLGRHVVEAALARGHAVTLFNRGQHNPELYPEAEKLRGDRDGGLDALAGRDWDPVGDTFAYVPRLAGDAARRLADHVGHYTFVSSISVYADFKRPGLDEDAALGTLPDDGVEEVNGETYGPLKALCERAAEAALPGRVNHVRAGLIVGPHDQSDRFTYWVRRAARGGEMLAPVGPDYPVQWVDVRDLAEWIVAVAEAGTAGAFNATGPERPLPLGRLLDACRRAAGSDAAATWVDEAFLTEQKVGAWVELPLWAPAEAAGIMQVDCARARAAGLRFRTVDETVADTLAWDRTRPQQEALRAGLTPEREAELLRAWRTR